MIKQVGEAYEPAKSIGLNEVYQIVSEYSEEEWMAIGQYNVHNTQYLQVLQRRQGWKCIWKYHAYFVWLEITIDFDENGQRWKKTSNKQ